MKPRFMERLPDGSQVVNINMLAEYDPTPRYCLRVSG